MTWILVGNNPLEKDIDKEKGRAGCVKIGLKHKDVTLNGERT